MRRYRVATPKDYATIVSKLKSGDLEEVLITRTETKETYPLLSLVKEPFVAYVDKITCYSFSGPQQSLSLGKIKPHQLEIGETPIQGGPYQLLIKK